MKDYIKIIEDQFNIIDDNINKILLDDMDRTTISKIAKARKNVANEITEYTELTSVEISRALVNCNNLIDKIIYEMKIRDQQVNIIKVQQEILDNITSKWLEAEKKLYEYKNVIDTAENMKATVNEKRNKSDKWKARRNRVDYPKDVLESLYNDNNGDVAGILRDLESVYGFSDIKRSTVVYKLKQYGIGRYA